jgi:limonene 1,2-monooxygenase
MFRAHEWANRTDTMKSFELFARWVMPQFQGSIDPILASQEWTRQRRKDIFVPSIAAVKKAYDDAGRAAPEDFKKRLLGVIDEDTPKKF